MTSFDQFTTGGDQFPIIEEMMECKYWMNEHYNYQLINYTYQVIN